MSWKLLISQRLRRFGRSSFLNVLICCFCITYLIVNEESGFETEKKELRNHDGHFIFNILATKQFMDWSAPFASPVFRNDWMTQQSLEKMMSIKLPAEDCHLLLAQVLVNTGKGVDSCLPLVCVCVCVCVSPGVSVWRAWVVLITLSKAAVLSSSCVIVIPLIRRSVNTR